MKRVPSAVLIDKAHQGLGKLACAQFPANEFFDRSLGHRAKMDLDEIIRLFPRLWIRGRSMRAATGDHKRRGNSRATPVKR